VQVDDRGAGGGGVHGLLDDLVRRHRQVRRHRRVCTEPVTAQVMMTLPPRFMPCSAGKSLALPVNAIM